MRLYPWLATLVLGFCLGLSVTAHPQAPPSALLRKAPVMTRRAEGFFDVKTTPLAADDATMGTLIGRYSIVKQYHGDLEATARGEMISAGEPSSGNAGYVAIEQVTRTLSGHIGSFSLQHIGAMESGSYKLSVAVVPGSGTAQLTGLAGTLTITIAAGKHSYSFEYTLPPPAQ